MKISDSLNYTSEGFLNLQGVELLPKGDLMPECKAIGDRRLKRIEEEMNAEGFDPMSKSYSTHDDQSAGEVFALFKDTEHADVSTMLVDFGQLCMCSAGLQDYVNKKTSFLYQMKFGSPSDRGNDLLELLRTAVRKAAGKQTVEEEATS